MLSPWFRRRLSRCSPRPRRPVRPVVEALEERRLLTTYSVTKVADDGTAHTLRWAINQANADTQADTITFAIGTPGTQHTISPTSGLPGITNPSGVTIDGWTQGGSGYVGAPLIELDGTSAGDINGLLIKDSNSTVRGLTIDNWGSPGGQYGFGIVISGEAGTATGNLVEGCRIGTGLGGAASMPNAAAGVEIGHGAAYNTVGGAADGHSNLIAGNGTGGIRLDFTYGNLIQNDYIGTNGTKAIANGGSGVRLDLGAYDNTIGGTVAVDDNYISGNTNEGVLITGGAYANLVQNNYIGTTPGGGAAQPNGDAGVVINGGAYDNTIGGTTAVEDNYISGNLSDGVRISDVGTTGNLVQNNYIGTNNVHSTAVGNGGVGVLIENGATNTTVGGPGVDYNVIAGNAQAGVEITDAGTTGNLVLNDDIGVAGDGISPVPNGGAGVVIQNGAGNNTVGGAASASYDVISGNTTQGVVLSDPGTTGNVVRNDYIGTDYTGTRAVPNGLSGVLLQNGAGGNTVGGAASADYNVISGNGTNGISIVGSTTSGNLVRNNLIGTTGSGLAPLGNQQRGIFINGAPDNTVGGTAAADRNVIAGNGAGGPFNGILIANAGATGNVVQGNYLGLGSDGTTALPNSATGVCLGSLATDNTVGGTAAGAGNRFGANGTGGNPGFVDSVVVDDWTGSAHSGTPGVRNTIRANAITDIATGNNGIYLTPGANHDQAAPALGQVGVAGGPSSVTGSLDGAANTSFALDFFRSTTASPPQGQTYLASVTVTTNAAGHADFTAALGVAVTSSQFVTATATNLATGDTSSFSPPATPDGTAPAVTLVEPAGGSTVSTATPTFRGTAGTAAGDLGTVTVKVYAGTGTAGTPVETLTTTAVGGAWSVAASPALAGGTYTAQAQQADAVGNVGLSSANTFTVASGPAVTLTSPANGSCTNSTTPTFGGAAGTAPGDLGTITVNVYAGATAAGTPVEMLTAMAVGSRWSVTASPPLAEGTYTAQAQQSDGAGKTGFSSPSTFTVDTTPPTSNVAPLPAAAAPSFTVRWSGADNRGGCGIAFYDVYVSIDGGAFARFLTATTQTSTSYPGSPGHSYGFYTVATDNAGNRETAPTIAQATTTVPVPQPQPQPQPQPTLPRGITAHLVTVKSGKKRLLMIEVDFADTGATKSRIASPFQKPRYSAISVAVKDSNGDGVADEVVLTARKGKRTVTATFPG